MMARGLLTIALIATGVLSFIALTTYTTLGNVGAGIAVVIIMTMGMEVIRLAGS